ncbi:Anoctamin [Dirofilaria immitis]|nr:Anoctamin [Dirofilaria immitis]
MHSPLSANNNGQQSVDDNDGRSVHLIYSEYDSAPSETEVEIIEGAKHYWWQSSKSNGREVCFIYSDYDEPSSETSVEMSKLFYDNRTSGREVRLIYSDYDEPPSETDVEYDGRPWCSILVIQHFGKFEMKVRSVYFYCELKNFIEYLSNAAVHFMRVDIPHYFQIDKSRELHLIYSDYTEPKSEAVVEIDCDAQSEIVKSREEIPWSTDNISSNDNHSAISTDIYTRRPPRFCSAHVTDSLEFIGETEKIVMPVQYLDNMEQLLEFMDNNVNEDSVVEYLEGQELNTAKDNLMVSSISTNCNRAMENLFALDQNASSNYVMNHDGSSLYDSIQLSARTITETGISLIGNRKHYLKCKDCLECESLKNYEISKLQQNDSRTTYFKDGKRKIDYVLTYEYNEMDSEESSKTNNVENELGLELEYVEGKFCKRTHFVLVHAPFSLLMKQAENVCLKMPVLQCDVKGRTVLEGILDKFMKRFRFLTFDEKTNERLKEPNYFTAPFVAAYLECYVGHENPDTFFDDSERSRLVYDLLIRTRYDTYDAEKYRVGIQRLIKNGTYTSAFPLHEECEWNEYNADRNTDREFLYWNWAQYYKHLQIPTTFFNKRQIDHTDLMVKIICAKKYFGSKVGWYFAWLGYYSKVLVLASIIGLLCFTYGILTISEDIPSNDICGVDGIGAKVILCPTCDKYCDYTRLNASCIYSKLSYVFDNTSTVIFAAMMSIFATLFLEGWKRYHAEVAWKWGLLDFEVDEETVRPEYQLRVEKAKTMRINPVTQQLEPYLTFTYRFLHLIGSGVTLFLVIAFVVGIIIYRIIFSQVLYRVDKMESYANLLTFTTAAILNLLYSYLALKLTNWECPRTQLEFDNSYTFKYVSCFIYHASQSSVSINWSATNMPERFSATSQDQLHSLDSSTYILSSVPERHYFGLRPEECDPAGCMVELVIQLAIIMCGKQFWNGVVEFAWPVLMTWLRSLRLLETKKQRDERTKHELVKKLKGRNRITRWEQDYILNPAHEQFLFDEYLEMVIQFGFVTLFVSAFPLAPLFALLNNIFEIRVDAYKYVVATRRPVPERARDIGIWLPILSMISRISVLVNACIIAFTSDFIPRFVYRFVYMHDELYGYVNNSLSFYDSSGIFVRWSEFKNDNITVCRFRDYRKPPCTIGPLTNCDDDYGFTMQWWIVFTFRLAFVLIFEASCSFLFLAILEHNKLLSAHLVAVIKAVIAYVIPNIPTSIFIQLQRQRFLARQARISDITTAVSAEKTNQNKVKKKPEELCPEQAGFSTRKVKNEQAFTDDDNIYPQAELADDDMSRQSNCSSLPPPHPSTACQPGRMRRNFDIRNPISQSWKNSDFAIMGIKQFYRFCSEVSRNEFGCEFLRLVEVRQNDDHTSSLWTRGKLEPGLLIGVLDKQLFATLTVFGFRSAFRGASKVAVVDTVKSVYFHSALSSIALWPKCSCIMEKIVK